MRKEHILRNMPILGGVVYLCHFMTPPTSPLGTAVDLTLASVAAMGDYLELLLI